jgi:hypothetical protein
MNRATTAIAAVFGAALLAAPMHAADEPKVDLNEAVKKLEAAVKKLEAVEAAFKSAGTTEKALNEYKVSNSAAMREIKDDIYEIKRRIDQPELDGKLSRQSAAASSPSSTSKREAMPEGSAKLATIKLSNDYFELMSIDVNGVTYQLWPGQTRMIKIEPGIFSFQAPWQSVPQQRVIRENEVKPIRIYTQ